MFLLDLLRGVFGGHVSPVAPPPPLAPLPPPVNAAGWQQVLLAYHNEARASRRAGPLELDQRLNRVAQDYAAWMAEFAVLPADHAGGIGNTKLAGRIYVHGFSFSAAGENTARGQRTPDLLFDGLMVSPAHYANVVRRYYSRVGFGMSIGSDGHPYWCVVYAHPAAAGQEFACGPDWCPPGLDALAPEQE